MNHRIACFTLFDITKTDITNRKAPINLSVKDLDDWEYKRNSQCNFDTIIQVISLRAQPERITKPIEDTVILDDFDKFVLKEAHRLRLARDKVSSFKWHVDHIVPVSKGGASVWDNLQVVPALWNRRKSNKHSARYVG